jgi:hypothetical protein
MINKSSRPGEWRPVSLINNQHWILSPSLMEDVVKGRKPPPASGHRERKLPYRWLKRYRQAKTDGYLVLPAWYGMVKHEKNWRGWLEWVWENYCFSIPQGFITVEPMAGYWRVRCDLHRIVHAYWLWITFRAPPGWATDLLQRVQAAVDRTSAGGHHHVTLNRVGALVPDEAAARELAGELCDMSIELVGRLRTADAIRDNKKKQSMPRMDAA